MSTPCLAHSVIRLSQIRCRERTKRRTGEVKGEPSPRPCLDFPTERNAIAEGTIAAGEHALGPDLCFFQAQASRLAKPAVNNTSAGPAPARGHRAGGRTEALAVVGQHDGQVVNINRAVAGELALGSTSCRFGRSGSTRSSGR